MCMLLLHTAVTAFAEHTTGPAPAETPLFSFGCIADIQYADKEAADGRRYSEGRQKLAYAIEQLNGRPLACVVNLGDLSDGIKKEDTAAVLDVYKSLKHRIIHVAGNHDMVLNRESELKETLGLASLNYTIDIMEFRFVVINSLDVSVFSNDPEKKRLAKEILAANPAFRPYDGKLSAELLSWMEQQFREARAERKNVIVCSHVPAYGAACAVDPGACLWNSAETLELLSRYNDVVRLWLSGHHHPGGYAVRDDIHHLTVPAVGNAPENGNAFAIIDVYSSKLVVQGFGTVPSRVLTVTKQHTSPPRSSEKNGIVRGAVTDGSGRPVAGAWVMTDNGRVLKSAADGSFSFAALSAGAYAVKTLAPGMEASLSPGISVIGETPAVVHITMKNADTADGIVYGYVKDRTSGQQIYATLEIKDERGPVRWFDIAGVPFGGKSDVPATLWHDKNRRFWTSGTFAFMAAPGKAAMTVKADGYAPVNMSIDVQSGKETPVDIIMDRLYDPVQDGWYKGDFHAHGVHGENIYRVNIPFMSYILRAERYHWFYLSADFNNDGIKTDSGIIAQQEGGDDLFLMLNAEYPKSKAGHVGNIGIAPPKKALPYATYANAEIIKRDIVDKGGAAVPVHPLTGHMRNRELPFIILGAPELICGFDFYTGWTPPVEKLWTTLLNKGYRLCRTATSDAAFDVGRSPGTMGATFIHPRSVLNNENIVAAFKEGRTFISWDGALLLFTVDGRVCGESFPSGDAKRKAEISLCYAPGAKTVIKVLRNGEPFMQLPATVPPTGRISFDFELSEKAKAWYTAMCALEGKSDKVIAATSPFYFGDWTTPAPALAKVNVTVFDADTQTPVNAKVEIIDSGRTVQTFNAMNGSLSIDARIFHRITVSASGYTSVEKSILGSPALASFISDITEEGLQDWTQYEKALELLQSVHIDFPMKRK
ncbi:MAG: CehA/McbA family metallohydrolase [Spirochaetes bacterium]|nr:CehA/McbA family metallohydrolase [Spirochaetota bacterium]